MHIRVRSVILWLAPKQLQPEISGECDCVKLRPYRGDTTNFCVMFLKLERTCCGGPYCMFLVISEKALDSCIQYCVVVMVFFKSS